MMVAVLKARFRAEAAHASVTMDRGSEMGACMEFELDDGGSEADVHGCMGRSRWIDVNDNDLMRDDHGDLFLLALQMAMFGMMMFLLALTMVVLMFLLLFVLA